MKVILQKDVPSLGEMGDTVDVRPGYARNYLIPYDLAVPATPTNLERARSLLKQHELRRQNYLQDCQKMAQTLAGKSIVIQARANEAGHLYGSVGPREIASAINELYNTKVAEEHVVSGREPATGLPFKQLGSTTVLIRFLEGVEAEVSVQVVAETSENAAADADTGAAST